MKNSSRIAVPAGVVALLVAVSLWSCEGDGPTSFDGPIPTELGQFGSLVDSTEYVASPETLPPFALDSSGKPPTLAPSVILSNLLAVAQQGTDSLPGAPGTCEAQAFGYGLGSYTAAQEPDGTFKWNPADPSNAASAAFLFARALADTPRHLLRGAGARLSEMAHRGRCREHDAGALRTELPVPAQHPTEHGMAG